MTNERFDAVVTASHKKPVEVIAPVERPSEYFGKKVFNRAKMYKYLPADVYQKLIDVIDNGATLDRSIADAVAKGMKQWADENGVTHYTHWFQPLTEGTAEKHDSFIEHDGKGGMIEEFSGKLLVQQEPDASSFPSGGIRSTFEARGYSAWDPTSPVFIIDDTLCIPTIFISYTGEALDYKAPLLRALHAVNVAATNVCHYFYPDVKKVISNLGWEQEYFLVDEDLYAARPDLILTGRTLMGHESAKNQQMDDHYFGTIPERVQAFMKDLEIQALELGIPVKTRHNEVAPNQFECAPIFEETNLAVDHNMLLMSLMKRVAHKHGFEVLLHEKPFDGINGSGKHNNWSISYGDRNLLNPGTNPHENAIFLTTLCAVIQAVDKHADLLRSATAGAGNDHRLGANEAPPAIISMFLGEQLADIIDQIEAGAAKSSKNSNYLKVGVDTLPPLPTDATDRNRTSPFAFTGNKFEFRAAGSSQSCASPNIVLNTIVAEAFDEIATKLEVLPKADFQKGLQKILQSIVKAHKRVIFNGDGYKENWKKEAAKRGLPNLPNTPAALEPLKDPKNIELFKKYGVFNSSEMLSRYEVFMEEYSKKVHIETALALNISKTIIMPAAEKYLGKLAETAKNVADAKFGKNKGLEAKGKLINALVDKLASANDKLEKLVVENADPLKKLAAMGDVRTIVDKLEVELDDALWPMPKYSELLFIY